MKKSRFIRNNNIIIFSIIFFIACNFLSCTSEDKSVSNDGKVNILSNNDSSEKDNDKASNNKTEINKEDKTEKEDNVKEKEDTATEKEEPIKEDSEKVSGELKVHFIDVGQADSILITQGESSMLIDAGNNGDGNLVKSYIAQQGITKLDYVVGTHVHEDHIGGLDYVINAFKIGKVYFPRDTSSTVTFRDFITAVKNKNLKLTAPKVGETFMLGDAKCQIIAPNSSEYEDANDYSIVIRVTYGEKSFIFTGDADNQSENEMVANGLNLKADVLKVGHHGSSYSTSIPFLNKVSPKYAVISVGEDNKYGHPSLSTMDTLKSRNIPVYRTDESGTIVATCDGHSIKFSTKPGSYKQGRDGDDDKESSSSTSSNKKEPSTNTGNSNKNEEHSTTVVPSDSENNEIVYITNTGKKYHREGCSSLSRSKIKITKSEAEKRGYTPCARCHP